MKCPFCPQLIISQTNISHCPNCENVEIIANKNDQLEAYYISIKYKGRCYWACFENVDNPQYPQFSIQYWDDNKKLLIVLTLPFFPNITPANFPDKLKTFLTFS
jgi:hypothetical protein